MGIRKAMLKLLVAAFIPALVLGESAITVSVSPLDSNFVSTISVISSEDSIAGFQVCTTLGEKGGEGEAFFFP